MSWEEEKAHSSFQSAASMLNGLSINDLWAISSQLSSMDYYIQTENIDPLLFMSVLHEQRIAMFDRAILNSTANERHESILDLASMTHMWNLLVRATYFEPPRIDPSNPGKQLLEVIAKIANAQFQFQGFNFSTSLARSYVLYSLIPDQEQSNLAQLYKKGFVDIPTTFHNHTGLTIREYLTISFVIFAFYLLRYSENFKIRADVLKSFESEMRSSSQAPDQVFKLVMTLIEKASPNKNSFFMTPKSLVVSDSHILNETLVETYFNSVARTNITLRNMSYEKVHRLGNLSQRLSPLERYPIVHTASGHFIIPNMRYFDGSIEKFIHYELQSLYPNNEFSTTFGHVFEKYVGILISERAKSYTVIPETSYGKEEKKGPDYTLLNSEDKSLIAIEVKAKKFTLNTKLDPYSKSLEKDLDGVYSALRKLPGKIDDLRTGIPEYKKWQSLIDMTQQDYTYCVVIVSGSLNFLAEIISQIRTHDRHHFLNEFDCKYAIMTIESFELMLEISHCNDIKLSELVKSYWEATQDLTPKSHAAELFGGITPKTDKFFLNQYIDELFDEVKMFGKANV